MMMERLTENKIVLIKRKTRLEELLARYNTIAQAKFYIEHLGSDFSDYIVEDERYKKAVAEAHSELELLGRVQVVDREYVPNFIFGDHDIVVVVGQDGLVANTLNIDYLYFSVREPFPSRTSKADIVFGKVTKDFPLKIVSQMPENGVIFSDGVESDYLQFNSGIEAAISIAEKKGLLVV